MDARIVILLTSLVLLSAKMTSSEEKKQGIVEGSGDDEEYYEHDEGSGSNVINDDETRVGKEDEDQISDCITTCKINRNSSADCVNLCSQSHREIEYFSFRMLVIHDNSGNNDSVTVPVNASEASSTEMRNQSLS